jgi:hypothetical protein
MSGRKPIKRAIYGVFELFTPLELFDIAMEWSTRKKKRSAMSVPG